MAFVQAPVWQVTFTFQDNNFNQSTTSLLYRTTLAYADVLAEAALVATAAQALSDARLVSYTVQRKFFNDDTTAIPATAEVERKLSIGFSDATGFQKSRVEVPSPVFSIEQAGTDVVDPANPLVAALVTAITLGNLGIDNGAVATGGGDLTKLTATPKVIHRGRK